MQNSLKVVLADWPKWCCSRQVRCIAFPWRNRVPRP